MKLFGVTGPDSHQDLPPKVTGQVTFTADTARDDTLYAGFLLSPHPHARIRSVDKRPAFAMPGVRAVLTGADIGLHLLGRSLRDYPVLATDRVLFPGQRVAVVAAEDLKTAREAAGCIEVDYEVLDPVLDPEWAEDECAPDLHPGLQEYFGAGHRRGGKNVQGQERSAAGTGLSAFPECDTILDHEFTWPRTHAGPLEPHACHVIVSPEQVHVYSAHKEPFRLRRDLALVSGRAESEFAVEAINIGGDFGGKGSTFIEAACYFLALETGRPVMSVMTYLEMLTSTAARSPGVMRLRTGLKDGRIHAHQARTRWDGGAFAAIKPRPALVPPAVGVPLLPYDAPNRDEASICVYTNSLPSGQVRSPGDYQGTYAGECHIDMIARAMGQDSLQFRLDHVAVPEARRVLEGVSPIVARWRAEPRLARPGHAAGIGVALFHRRTGTGTTRVRCLATSQHVELTVGVQDQGCGSFPTFAIRAAEVLRVPVDRVDVRAAGAAQGLMDFGAGASRVTAVAGRACEEACFALLARLGEPPAAASPEVYWVGERLASLGETSVEVEGEWTSKPGDPQYTAASHGAMAVDVDVEIDTGRVRIVRAAIVIYGGRVLNPAGYVGQIEGGFAFGLSQALYEDLAVEDGQVVTASLGDYKMACASDVPPLEIVILPQAEGDTTIRGIGELANLGPAPAIANAIHDATGARITQLPITAERIWAAMAARDQRG